MEQNRSKLSKFSSRALRGREQLGIPFHGTKKNNFWNIVLKHFKEEKNALNAVN
jgi:hypothetical protein